MKLPRIINCHHPIWAPVLLWAIIILIAIPIRTCSSEMFEVFWNTTNPMFRIDNTDNIIDINNSKNSWEYDQVNIICPIYRKGTREADIERYIIYNVSRDEFEHCRISNPNPRVIAVCDEPHDLRYYTITFRSFTPTPGGLEFHPGQNYYFISTSSRDNLHERVGGRCSSHNMRVIFKVSDNARHRQFHHYSPHHNHEEKVAINVPRLDSYQPASVNTDLSRRKGPSVSQEWPPPQNADSNHPLAKDLLNQYHKYLYTTHEIEELDSNSVEHNKRSEDYSSQVLLKQASKMHSSNSKSSSCKSAQSNSIVSILICLCLIWRQYLLPYHHR